MIINLPRVTALEREIIEEMASKKDMSLETLVIQALRLYQDHDRKLENGETYTWSGDAERARQFKGE